MFFILRLVIMFFLVEGIIGLCSKNPKKSFLYILNSFGGIFCFLPIFCSLAQNQYSILDVLPFILCGLFICIGSLIYFCIDLINKKKSIIYEELQNRIDNWK